MLNSDRSTTDKSKTLRTCNVHFSNKVDVNENDIEKCIFISQIPHIRQQFSYDCGITCIRMAVRYCDEETARNEMLESIVEKQAARREGLWSIELLFILSDLGIRSSFYTKMLGADESYANTIYYANSIARDGNRINDMFQMAERRGMSVHRKSVQLEQILKHLSLRLPVISLVNANKLRCSHCESCTSVAFKQLILHFYQGHYIILVGYDAASNCILYRDPGSRDTLCSTSVRFYENARKSQGTDEDLLFLYTNRDYDRY